MLYGSHYSKLSIGEAVAIATTATISKIIYIQSSYIALRGG